LSVSKKTYDPQLLRRCWFATVVCLAGGLVAYPGVAIGAAGATQDADTESTRFYRSLRFYIWEMYALADIIPADFRGRTIADDLRTYGLTFDEARQLDQQLASGAAQGGQDGLLSSQVNSLALMSQLSGEAERLAEISNYWIGTGVAARTLTTSASFLQTNRLPGKQDHTPTVRAVEKRLLEELEAGDFKTAGRVTAPELAGLIGEEQRAMTRVHAERLSESDPVGDFRDRTAPCRALSPDSPERPDYPPTARRQFQEGSMVLRMRLSREGCVLAAAVLMSSGYAALDDAAVDWALNRGFSPAALPEVEGGHLKVLSVAFKIQE
jgi:TonB family protein